MTSNERKILECIWNHGGEVDIRLIGDKTGLSSDYSQYLCRALESAGHLELSGYAFCRLSERGQKYFQDRDNVGVIVVSFAPQEEPVRDPALIDSLLDDKDDESKGDEYIEGVKEDQEVKQDSATQQADYGAGEKQDDDIDKKLEELFSNEDEDENKDDKDAAQETEENVSGNDVDICISMTEHNEEGIEKFGEI